jgi:hypothetical protein
MSYQSGDILISEFDGFVNDIYVIVEEAANTHYKSYVVYSREQDINLVYPEIYLLNTTVSGEEYRSKYGIKK